MYKYRWSLSINKSSYSAENINSFLKNMYDNRDLGGLQISYSHIDMETPSFVHIIIEFESEFILEDSSSVEIIKYVYAILKNGKDFTFQDYIGSMRQTKHESNFEYLSIGDFEKDITFW